MSITKAFPNGVLVQTFNGVSDLIGVPPHRCWSLKQVGSESNLFSICALTGNQVLAD
jgi:hypothetical protein